LLGIGEAAAELSGVTVGFHAAPLKIIKNQLIDV
jgi:hypothetical protein